MFSQALILDPFVQNGKSAISERHTKESTVNQRTTNSPTLEAPAWQALACPWEVVAARHAEFIKRGKNRVAKSSRLATVH
jgi:hypothetical protein